MGDRQRKQYDTDATENERIPGAGCGRPSQPSRGLDLISDNGAERVPECDFTPTG